MCPVALGLGVIFIDADAVWCCSFCFFGVSGCNVYLCLDESQCFHKPTPDNQSCKTLRTAPDASMCFTDPLTMHLEFLAGPSLGTLTEKEPAVAKAELSQMMVKVTLFEMLFHCPCKPSSVFCSIGLI